MTGGDLNPVSGMKILTILAAASMAALAGCGTTSQTTSRSGGGLLGLASGGTPGGGTAASRISAMNGGLVGGTIGAGLNAGEKRSALEAEYKALEYTASGQKVAWQGVSGHSGEVVAAQPYRVGKTDKTEGPERDELEKALRDMGSSGYALIDPVDEIAFLETALGGTGYKGYDNLEARCEAKVSKNKEDR